MAQKGYQHNSMEDMLDCTGYRLPRFSRFQGPHYYNHEPFGISEPFIGTSTRLPLSRSPPPFSPIYLTAHETSELNLEFACTGAVSQLCLGKVAAIPASINQVVSGTACDIDAVLFLGS